MNHAETSTPPKNRLVIQTGGIGDFVVATTTFRIIRQDELTVDPPTAHRVLCPDDPFVPRHKKGCDLT